MTAVMPHAGNANLFSKLRFIKTQQNISSRQILCGPEFPPTLMLYVQRGYNNWFDKGEGHLSIWSRSCVAWYPQRAAVPELAEDENVNPSRSFSDEPRDHNELLQCKILQIECKYMVGSMIIFNVLCSLFQITTSNFEGLAGSSSFPR